MAKIQVDLNKVAPELSKRIDDLKEKAKAFDKALYSLNLWLGYEITIDAENVEDEDEE